MAVVYATRYFRSCGFVVRVDIAAFGMSMRCVVRGPKARRKYVAQCRTRSASTKLTAELQRRMQAMKMRCYRKILSISYRDHVTNEEVRAKIQRAIGPHKNLLTVKRRKLRWYRYVYRSSGLAKTSLQGTVKGGRRQGRQRKRWVDNIREWTGLEFAKFQRAVENRENGENWLRNHLWCPKTLAVKRQMR